MFFSAEFSLRSGSYDFRKSKC